jgi:hypothetical protein
MSARSRSANEKGARARRSQLPDDEYIAELQADEAYADLNVRREYGKMVRWCETNRKQPTRRRFINWLNRADRPLNQAGAKPPDTEEYRRYVADANREVDAWLQEGAGIQD